MLSAQRALRCDPGRRQGLNRRGDVLMAFLAADHERAPHCRALKHETSLGEYKEKVIL